MEGGRTRGTGRSWSKRKTGSVSGSLRGEILIHIVCFRIAYFHFLHTHNTGMHIHTRSFIIILLGYADPQNSVFAIFAQHLFFHY